MTDTTELSALLAKATPGPWWVDGPVWNQIIWTDNENRVCFMAHSSGLDDDRDTATAALIAMAPTLAADVLRLTANLEHWRQEVGKLHSQIDRLKHDRDIGAKDYCALMERHDSLTALVREARAIITHPDPGSIETQRRIAAFLEATK